MRELSIVIPTYNSAASIQFLVEAMIDQTPLASYEIILVDDGSRDGTGQRILELAKRHPDIVRSILLSKNFGEHQAVMAGLNHASGDYAVIMDDDFQNPPQEALRLLDKAKKDGLDVVYGVYQRKQHSLYRNLGSKLNDWMANILICKPRGLYLSSFKCMSRFTYREVKKYCGPYPYIDGLVFRVTDNVGSLVVEHHKREHGKSGYTFAKLVRLWANMVFNFSILPLRASMILGFAAAFIGCILAISSMLEKWRNPDLQIGWASLFSAIILFSGVQLIVFGLIGEYVGRMFLLGNKAPQFVVKHDTNLLKHNVLAQKSDSHSAQVFASPHTPSRFI
jgi:glycosyltransferase involved in cell wall biosynthesis